MHDHTMFASKALHTRTRGTLRLAALALPILSGCVATSVARAQTPAYVPPIAATATTTLYSGTTTHPDRVGIDRAGNIYAVISGTLEKIPVGSSTPIQLVTGMSNKYGNSVVIDPNGNLWASAPQEQSQQNSIYAVMLFIPAVNGIPNISSFSTPQAWTAVESTKCATNPNGALPTQPTPCSMTLYDMTANKTNCVGGTTASSPQLSDFTVDAGEWVYFIDTYDTASTGKSYRIVKVNPMTGPGQGTVLKDSLTPDNLTNGYFSQITRDGAGNLFYLDANYNNGAGKLSEVSATACTLTEVGQTSNLTFASIAAPKGISSDPWGNLFITGATTLSEVPFETGALNFTDEFALSSTLPSATNLGGGVDRHGNFVYQAGTNIQYTEIGGHNFGTVSIGNTVTTTAPPLQLFFNSAESIGYNSLPTTSPNSNNTVATLQNFPFSGQTSINPTLVNGTLTPAQFAAGSTANLTVDFQPLRAGLLRGAYAPQDASNVNLAVFPLQGVGSGPQPVFGPVVESTLFTSAESSTDPTKATLINLKTPSALSVDTYGDVFVADTGNARVVADCLGSTTFAALSTNSLCAQTGYASNIVSLPFTFSSPASVKLDGANNVYVLDSTDNTVTEIQSATVTASTLVSAATSFNGAVLSGPKGLAIDGYGDLYIADTNNNRIVLVHQTGAQAIETEIYVPASTLFGTTALNQPEGLAVDAQGDLFIADTKNNRIVEYSVQGAATVVTTTGVTLSSPTAVEVLPSGSLLVSDSTNGVVWITGGTAQVFPFNTSTFSAAPGIALDQQNNLYLADVSGNQVLELKIASPATAATFPTTLVNTTSSTSDELSLYNFGNAPLTVASNPAIDYGDTNFAVGSSGTCAANLNLTSDQSCTIYANFTPHKGAPVTGAVQVVDNARDTSVVIGNSGYQSAYFQLSGIQSINLNGTGACATAPAPSPSVYSGTYTQSFSVVLYNCVTNATMYYTTDGTTPTAASTLYTGASIPISVPTVLQAIAVMADGTVSPVSTATYSFYVPTPTFTGSVSGSTLNLSISDKLAAATIYYTTDDTTPTTSSSVFSSNSAPLALPLGTVLNAMAAAPNYTNSAIATNQSTVNYGSLKEVIRGIGATTAFLGTEPAAAMNTLYGSGTNQLGLSILRVAIDPTGTAPTWVTPEWSSELSNAQLAIAANPQTIVFATPWSPPAVMKSNVSAPWYTASGCNFALDVPPANQNPHYCGGDLDPAFYLDYANYLKTFVNYFAAGGVNLYAVSMQNEPEVNTNYQSTVWTPNAMDTWVANYASIVTASPHPTKFMMPESEVFKQAYSNPALADPNAVSHIDIIGGHLYGGPPAYYTTAENLNKDVWNTEHWLHIINGDDTVPTIYDALDVAEEIHKSFSNGDFNAYVWWRSTDSRPNDPTKSVQIGLIDANYNPTYFGYGIGQFARFVLPGYKRATAPQTPSGNVYITSYAGVDANNVQHYVIVAINANSTAVPQTFTLQDASVTSMTPTQTTSSGGLVQQAPVSVSGGSFTYTLPPLSITTLVN